MKDYKINLRLFDGNLNTNVTTQDSLSAEMRTYYDKDIIRNATPNLYHDQFGQKKNIPQKGGKTIQFRRYSPLGKATKPLTEGVTPDGQSLEVSEITATVAQYGNYVTVSDMLDMTAVDNNILEASELLGDQAGVTLDTITREIINGGTKVQYGEDAVSARYLLKGGVGEGSNVLTVDCIKRAVRSLKKSNAKKIDGSFVAIIHPDVSYDLTSDPKWENVKTYCDPKDMYNGEIGRIHGVRFVETTEAKVFHADNLTGENRNLTVKSVSGTEITVNEALTEADAAALAGRKVIIGQVAVTVVSATKEGVLNIDVAAGSTGDVIYPGEAGAEGRDVYSTLVLGANAYGVTSIENGGLKMIVKNLGSGGTGDPLDQRATVGWKATKTAERLVEDYMVRIETVSTFEGGAN